MQMMTVCAILGLSCAASGCTDPMPEDEGATRAAPTLPGYTASVLDSGIYRPTDASEGFEQTDTSEPNRDQFIDDPEPVMDADPPMRPIDMSMQDIAPMDAAPNISETEAFEDLLTERVGFGADASGGQGGVVCMVTHLADEGVGSLRHCIENAAQPTWVRFSVDGDIHLSAPISVPSNVTVDGRGQYIRIYDHGFRINRVSNVIITRLIFKEGDDDAIQLKHDTHTVWIHQVSLSNYGDGLIDITRGATDITVSWCKFSRHSKVMLIGADPTHDDDRNIRVTLHHNWFKRTNSRHPRLRFGKVHAYNNLYDEWGHYGIGCSQLGQCYSEANIFQAGDNSNAILRRIGEDDENGKVVSINDREEGDVDISEGGTVFSPGDFYDYQAERASSGLADRIRDNAGWQ